MKFPEKLTERMQKARTMSTIAYFQKEWGVKESREVVLTSKMKSVAQLLISPLAHNFTHVVGQCIITSTDGMNRKHFKMCPRRVTAMWDPGTRRKRNKVGHAAIKTISAKSIQHYY